jgi:hypothetical protein
MMLCGRLFPLVEFPSIQGVDAGQRTGFSFKNFGWWKSFTQARKCGCLPHLELLWRYSENRVEARRTRTSIFSMHTTLCTIVQSVKEIERCVPKQRKFSPVVASGKPAHRPFCAIFVRTVSPTLRSGLFSHSFRDTYKMVQPCAVDQPSSTDPF